MAVATNAFTAADLVAVITETWTPLLLEQYFAKGTATRFFRDLSPFAAEGSDIFHVPDLFTNAHSVSSQTTRGAEISADSPTQVDVTLTVDTQKYIALTIDDFLMQQIGRNYDVGAMYARKIGGTLLHDIEDAIYALWSNVTTNTVNDTASVVADVDIRKAIEKLATLNVPLEDTAFHLHPYTYWLQIIQIQKYYDATQTGYDRGQQVTGTLGPADAAAGRMGTLFGIPVYVSSRVVNTLNAVENLLAGRDTFGYAFQTPGGKPVRVQSAPWLANIANLTVFDQIYGVKTLREKDACLIKASNAFIAS